jgi:protein-disulfide isomerase
MAKPAGQKRADRNLNSRQSIWPAVCRVLVLAAAATLAGCGGDVLPQTSSLSQDSLSPGSAFPSTTSEKRDASPPNPFADPTAGPLGGGREVIQSPTAAEILASGPLPDMAYGSPAAPVTIVEYASLTCPHCRRFHKDVFPELKRDYIDTGKVRFILREFPIGRTSGMATIALRCAPPDKYLELYGKFLDQQAVWVSQEVRIDAIFSVAQQVGMTEAEFAACRENQTMIEGLKWVKDRGRKLGIIGTPNFFVGEKLVKSVLTMDEIRTLIEPVLQSRSGPGAISGGL